MESRMSLLLRIICNICRGLIMFQVLFLVQVNSFLLKTPCTIATTFSIVHSLESRATKRLQKLLQVLQLVDKIQSQALALL